VKHDASFTQSSCAGWIKKIEFMFSTQKSAEVIGWRKVVMKCDELRRAASTTRFGGRGNANEFVVTTITRSIDGITRRGLGRTRIRRRMVALGTCGGGWMFGGGGKRAVQGTCTGRVSGCETQGAGAVFRVSAGGEMSRSGYDDCCDGWDLIRWRGAVASAIRGARGQAFLREMLDALDAMPDKRLIKGDLITETGEVCAIGAVCKKRGVHVSGIDVHDRKAVADSVGIAEALAAEIMYENDDLLHAITPEGRWEWMRHWCVEHLQAAGGGAA